MVIKGANLHRFTVDDVHVKKLSLSAFGATIYLEGNQSVLFIEKKQELILLSPLATLLALSCDTFDQSVNLAELSLSLNIPQAQLASEYQKFKALLQGQSNSVLTNSALTYQSHQYPEIKAKEHYPYAANKQHCCYLFVAGSYFAIETTDRQLSSDIKALLSPIIIETCQPDFVLSISLINDQQYQLSSNGLTVHSALKYQEIMPELIDHLQVLSYQASDYFSCFHGAALKKEEHILLLPGKSGKGKSTLCAALTDYGYQVYSDEFIVFDKSHALLPIRLPIAIKSGSWQQLPQYTNTLAKAKEWLRLDGRKIKYIWPTSAEIIGSDNGSVYVQIVFPHYQNQEQNRNLSPKSNRNFNGEKQTIGCIDTIASLTEGGYQLVDNLSEQSLDKFIAFITQCEKANLYYGSTQQALDLLGIISGELDDN